jgi:hypothetical protein
MVLSKDVQHLVFSCRSETTIHSNGRCILGNNNVGNNKCTQMADVILETIVPKQ